MSNDKIKCIWLNKKYGKGYWICDGLLKAVNEEICKKCKKMREKRKDELVRAVKKINNEIHNIKEG